jgi:hypothetical protein
MLKGKNFKEGAYTREPDEASIAVLTIIEEADHSLGQILMVVRVQDEVSPRATDTFAVEQRAGREAAEDLENDILREAG